MDVTEAYDRCELITRREARNFAYGIRLLPPPRRRALSAVYALARRVDDIGDGPRATEDKLAALVAVRTQLADVGGYPDDPVLVALADAAARLPIPLAAFGELVDGCEMDVRGTSYTSFDELHAYCRCVAGSIGRLSLGVFGRSRGGPDRPGLPDEELADALGVALQLTNIIRDVREDLRAGRVYLPKEDLARFGVELDPEPGGGFPADPEAFARLLRFQADRAEQWYRLGLGLLDRLDRRSAACAGAMAGIYHRLLRRLAAHPERVAAGRVSLPPGEKLAVAVQALAGRVR